MFHSLYGRLMALFLAVLLVAMAVLTVLMYDSIREGKVEDRMAELINQARDVAYLAAQRGLFVTREAGPIPQMEKRGDHPGIRGVSAHRGPLPQHYPHRR